MKKLSLIGLAAFGFVALSATAWATEYKLTYDATTSDDTLAFGKINVSSVTGLATSGFLDITQGIDVGVYKLDPAAGSDGYFIWDDSVDPTATAPNGFLDPDGLLFKNSTTGVEINLWYNPAPNSGNYTDYAFGYSLLGAPPAYSSSEGDAYLTPISRHGHECPDGGLTVALLGGALVGLQVLRRKLMA